MTFSVFTAYFNANKRNAPKSLADQVRREAIARVTERLQAGRADSELCFRDLVERLEAGVA
jgi:hypothetical protein